MSKFTILKPGDIGCTEYQNVRDREDISDFKRWVDKTTEEYIEVCGDSLNHLQTIAVDNFQGFLWQVFLFEYFKKNGLKLLRVGSEGPDFCIEVGSGQKVWIEAISVTRGQGEMQVPEPEYEDVEIDGTIVKTASWCRTHPDPLIKLRLTEAIQRKHGDFKDNGYLNYIEKGIIRDDEPFIIAINYGEIPFVFNVVDPSYISMTVFGLGPYSISIDRKTLKSVGGQYTIQPIVQKREEAIESAYFNRSKYNGISGIIASPRRVSSLKYQEKPQIEIVPNPDGKNAIPQELSELDFTSKVRFEDVDGGIRIHFK